MASTTILETVEDSSRGLPFREEIDEHRGHPGIRATTFSYGQINDDMLEMLEKKTSGNLENDEKKLLEEILHQLRMTFMEEQSA